MVEARWRQLVVSSDDAAADEQIAEAIARVVARHAVDLRSGVQVTMRHDGANVTYVARTASNLASAVRDARRPSTAPAVDATAAGALDPRGPLKQLHALAAAPRLHRAA